MSFNPNPSKQAQEVIFSRKVNKGSHPLWPLITHSLSGYVTKTSGCYTCNRLSFEEQLRLVFSKINRITGLLHKLQCLIPRSTILTIYKISVRPHLNYGDIIYEKEKIESIQYNACLGISITGAIRSKTLLLISCWGSSRF